tara:strand:+ start:1029 stop:1154 length:126 start_codon:yes stop_codon:yes gene_type:complete
MGEIKPDKIREQRPFGIPHFRLQTIARVTITAMADRVMALG